MVVVVGQSNVIQSLSKRQCQLSNPTTTSERDTRAAIPSFKPSPRRSPLPVPDQRWPPHSSVSREVVPVQVEKTVPLTLSRKRSASSRSSRPLPAIPSTSRNVNTFPELKTKRRPATSPTPLLIRPLPPTPTCAKWPTTKTGGEMSSLDITLARPSSSSQTAATVSSTSVIIPATSPSVPHPPKDSHHKHEHHQSHKPKLMIDGSHIPRSNIPPSPSHKRPVLTRLLTNFDQLHVPSSSKEVTLPVSPNSAGIGIPQPPTPETQKWRRLTKLRRHFGEKIPEEMVEISSRRRESKGIDINFPLPPGGDACSKVQLKTGMGDKKGCYVDREVQTQQRQKRDYIQRWLGQQKNGNGIARREELDSLFE